METEVAEVETTEVEETSEPMVTEETEPTVINVEATYLSKTVVQPKPVVEALTHQGTECSSIIKAFSKGSFSGIRSLPNNIHPDFRQESLVQTLENTKEEKSGRLARTRSGSSSYNTAKGQRRRQKYGGMPQTFTSYEYMSDPVQDKLARRRDEILKGKEKWLSADDFKTYALPRVHKYMGMLDRCSYSISPYENTEEAAKRENRETKQKILHGPVRAGGCVNQGEKARIRLKELLRSLTLLLKNDCPHATIDVFVDETGCIVVSYIKEGLSLKSLRVYMNKFAKENAKVHEFKLKKDATRWAVTNDDLENIFFILCPPWIHLKPTLNYRLHGARAKRDTSQDLALESGRIPFGPPTGANVRNLAYAFKT